MIILNVDVYKGLFNAQVQVAITQGQTLNSWEA